MVSCLGVKVLLSLFKQRWVISQSKISKHVCQGTTDMEAYIWILQRHKLPSRWHLSWEARQCQASFCTNYNWVFSRHSAPEGMCLPVYCRPDMSLMENVWPIMKRRIRQWWPQTVERLSCITQNWANTSLAKLQQLVSSTPKWLKSLIKRKGDVTQW